MSGLSSVRHSRSGSVDTAEVPRSDAPDELPLTVQFLKHLVAPGGYGLHPSHVQMGVRQWRESEIVAALLRDVRRRAPDALVGRIFTAVNQDGLVVLIGEAAEPNDSDHRAGANGHADATPADAPPPGLITDVHLSVCTLDPPVNLGAPDGRVARCVMLVMVPEDDVDAPWCESLERHECMRVIKRAFKRLAAHGAFLKTLDSAEHNLETDKTRRKIEELLGAHADADASLGSREAATRFSVEHPASPRRSASARRERVGPEELVGLLRRSVDALADAEARRLAGVDVADAELAAAKTYRHTGRFAGGLREDFAQRYAPHFVSDWTDGVHLKTVSACLLMYFGCLAPCIAFGALTHIETGGKMGTMEYLVAQAVSGVIFSLFAGQPEIVLRTTGPTTVFLIELSRVCDEWELPFATALAWTGIWASACMTIIALTDACAVMLKNCTRFTQEIFGMFVSAIFVSAGGQALADYFTSDEYDLAHALLSLLLALLTLQLGLWALAVRTSPFLLRFMREITADFGIAAAITVGTLVAWGSGVDGLEMLTIPSSIIPADGRGSWVVDLGAGPSWLPLCAAGPGALLALLMYVEMNISSLLANKPENNLAKGPAYHLNFLVMSLVTLGFSFFGLPPMTGSLPHSPQFIRALSDVEEITVGGTTKTKVIRVRENRLAPLAVYALIALTIVLLPVLREVPMAVLYGLFLYLGVTGLATSQLWTRIKMIAMDPRLLPPTHYVRRVPISRVHAFTLVQLACCAVLLGVRASPAALFFPLFIAALMPLRYTLTSKNVPLFTREMLKMLDMIAEGSNAEAGAEEAKAVDMGGNLGEGEETIRRRRDARRTARRNGKIRAGAADDGKDGLRRRPSFHDLAESTGININGADVLATLGPTPHAADSGEVRVRLE